MLGESEGGSVTVCSVGEAEGDSAGFLVGLKLWLDVEITGLALGEAVALRVGDAVGFFPVGSGVGAEELEITGLATPEIDGLKLGRHVGIGIGALVYVGLSVGISCIHTVIS